MSFLTAKGLGKFTGFTFLALITQTSTGVPTITKVIRNDFGVTPVITRNGVGDYTLTFTNPLQPIYVDVFIPRSYIYDLANKKAVQTSYSGDNVVHVLTGIVGGAAGENFANVPVEFAVGGLGTPSGGR